MDRFENVTRSPVVGEALNSLITLFAEMGDAYREQAAYYDFACDGCRDNCCQTRFYHHTLLEFIYLHQGLRSLPVTMRHAVLGRCREVTALYRKNQGGPDPLRVWCPLNEAGQCLIYRFRPMICRLHGIPHELQMPAGGVQHHPGCDTFARRIGTSVPYRSFDRTRFYRRMALLEQDLRRTLGFTRRLKLTVAEILLADTVFDTLPIHGNQP